MTKIMDLGTSYPGGTMSLESMVFLKSNTFFSCVLFRIPELRLQLYSN
jgi:hypothetical protein